MPKHPMVTREQLTSLLVDTYREYDGHSNSVFDAMADAVMALHFPRIEIFGEGTTSAPDGAPGSCIGFLFLPCPAGTRVQVVAIDEAKA